MKELKGSLLSPAVLVLLGALFFPFAWPLAVLLIPVIGFAYMTASKPKETIVASESPSCTVPEPSKVTLPTQLFPQANSETRVIWGSTY